MGSKDIIIGFILLINSNYDLKALSKTLLGLDCDFGLLCKINLLRFST